MLRHLVRQYGFNLHFTKMLVGDLTPEQMCAQPAGVVNHAAWSLGHLVLSADQLAQLVGLDSDLPDGYDALFSAGSRPTEDPPTYPSRDELLAELERQHARALEAVERLDPEAWVQSHPEPSFRQYFPTLGDHITFLMTAHEMAHLGQIAAWRRALGLGSATGVYGLDPISWTG